MKVVILSLVMSLTLSVSSMAQIADERFRREARQALASLADVFARADLFPIGIPQNQRPGDAYVWTDYWVLDTRTAACFEGLNFETIPFPRVDGLRVGEASGDARLSLLRILGLSGAARYSATVSVSYSEAQLHFVSRGDLIAHLSRPACQHLESALAGHRVPVGGWNEVRGQLNAPMLVLYRVVEAKRRIVISISDNQDGAVEIRNPQDFLRETGLAADPRARFIDGEAQARVGATRRQAILIEDAERVPVAYTPVSLPRIRTSTALSGGAGAAPTAVDWIFDDSPEFAEAVAAWRRNIER